MAKNHIMKFVVSKEQRDRILDNARMSGYSTISDYLRTLALNSNLITQIYDMLKNGTKN